MKSKAAVLEARQGELDLGVPELERIDWPELGEHVPPPLPEGRLEGFTTSVLAQAYTSDYPIVARLAEYTGVGAVMTLRAGAGSRFDRAFGAVLELKRRTRSGALLVDANEYSGKNRKSAGAGMDAAWIVEQHEYLGVTWALTNSGYAPTLDDVRTLLADGARLEGRVIVALPIPSALLRDHATELADAVREQGHPIALLLEDARDPFDEADAVRALAHVIHNCGNQVLLLRSDVSALGAISHGAAAGAVGGPGLRHIYPALPGGGSAPLAFVIPELLGYYTNRRFEKAYLRDPLHLAWSCGCWFCSGRDLTWIANQPSILVEASAMSHSVAALAGTAQILATHADPAAGWSAMCARARTLHEEIANPSGSSWTPKPALGHWQTLTPATAGR